MPTLGALHLMIVMCSAQHCYIRIEFTHVYLGALHLMIVMCSAQHCYISIKFTHAYIGCSAPHDCYVLCTQLLYKH
jgi:hypothetical protein